MTEHRGRICAIRIDGLVGTCPREIEAEKQIAIADLLEENTFELVGRSEQGPYHLVLSTAGARLALHVSDADAIHVVSHFLSLTPLRRVIRDYRTICDTHFGANACPDPYRFEAIDMARRGIHNEGSNLLRDRLASKVWMDLDTARGLFTLIVASETSRAGPVASGWRPSKPQTIADH